VWAGKGSDIFATVESAFDLCDEHGMSGFIYDADGMGAGVRGDARVLNRDRRHKLTVTPFRGSGAVVDPAKPVPTAVAAPREKGQHARTNGDFFMNAKAQGWWGLRVRFQRTFRALEAVRAGRPNPFDPDDLIFIDGRAPDLGSIIVELGQPTYERREAGKIMINKAPDGARSPNRGDAVMIRFAGAKKHYLSFLD